jgi:molybdopterin converting factor small subunit
MSIRVRLAHLLAERAGGQDDLELDGRTVGDVLHGLSARHPALAGLVWSGEEVFNPMLVAFLNGEDVRRLRGLETPVAQGDELMVVSALEGG